jgi:hypothetical protein
MDANSLLLTLNNLCLEAEMQCRLHGVHAPKVAMVCRGELGGNDWQMDMFREDEQKLLAFLRGACSRIAAPGPIVGTGLVESIGSGDEKLP